MGFIKAIADYLGYLAETIRSNMDRADVNATGQTSRSIAVKADENEGRLTASEVLEKTETGNPPKSEGGGISFFSAELWIAAKGLSLNPYGLKFRIDKEGTQTHQIGGRSDIYTDTVEDPTPRGLFLDEVAGEAVAQITKEFRN